MKWLPYETWEVQTPVDVTALAEGLRKRIAPLKVLRQIAFWRDDATQGKVTSDGFVFYPAAIYRWYDSPVISGRFTASPTGTTIRMKMTLHPIGIWFLVVLMAMIGFSGLLFLPVLVKACQWEFYAIFFAIALGMLVPAVGMTCYRYSKEAPRAKRLISLYIAGIEREVAGRAT